MVWAHVICVWILLFAVEEWKGTFQPNPPGEVERHLISACVKGVGRSTISRDPVRSDIEGTEKEKREEGREREREIRDQGYTAVVPS